MSRRSLALLLAVPLLLAPAACGGDDDDLDASSSTTEGGAATDDTATDDNAPDDTTGDTTDDTTDDTTGDDEVDTSQDQARVDVALEAILAEVTASGFAANPDDDDDDSTVTFDSEECQVFQDIFEGDELPDESASAESGEYERGQLGPGTPSETLEINVGLVRDTAALEEIYSVFRDPLFLSCMEEGINTTFEEQSAEAAASGGPTITVQELNVDALAPSGVGDDAAGVRVASVLETSGIEIPFVLELEFANVGRAAAMVMAGIIGAEELNLDRVAVLTGALAAVAASG